MIPERRILVVAGVLGVAAVGVAAGGLSVQHPTDNVFPKNNVLTQNPAPIPTPAMPVRKRQRGVSLGLFAEDISFDYRPLLREIKDLGATHVALVVPIYQEHAGSTTLALHTRLSPSLEATGEAIRAARRLGLEVTLFPIVRLWAPRAPGEWRGTLKPENAEAWFNAYADVLGDHAALAQSAQATRVVIGSEFGSLDGAEYLELWRGLIKKIRTVYSGTLLYSANWDRFRDARLLDLVDEIGVTAYFELRAKTGSSPSDIPALTARWRDLRQQIENWIGGRPEKQPFVFTEVGYRSRVGSSATPWDETPGGATDLEEQRRAFAAFRVAWQGADSLAGAYIWNWYGFGGASSPGYTPRGKPAAAEIKNLFRED